MGEKERKGIMFGRVILTYIDDGELRAPEVFCLTELQNDHLGQFPVLHEDCHIELIGKVELSAQIENLAAEYELAAKTASFARLNLAQAFVTSREIREQVFS